MNKIRKWIYKKLRQLSHFLYREEEKRIDSEDERTERIFKEGE